MKLKNVKLGDITLKDILKDIRQVGIIASNFTEGYHQMVAKIEKYLEQINEI